MKIATQDVFVGPAPLSKVGTIITHDTPTAGEYNKLRESAGWPPFSEHIAAKGLRGSLHTVSVRDNGELIGFGRLVGDGITTFYIQDVLVLGSRRGQGIARRLMNDLLGFIRTHGCPGAVAGLLAAPDNEAFYEAYGFVSHPNAFLGAGMSMTLQQGCGVGTHATAEGARTGSPR